MMRDYEFIFAKQLQMKLWNEVHASVKTWVVDDELHIGIRNEEHNIEFEYLMLDFAERLLHGLSTDYVVYEVKKRYKAFVLELFIK